MQPIADDIKATLSAKEITLSRPAGLALSTTVGGEPDSTIGLGASAFDPQVWGFNRKVKFRARQSDLIRMAAAAPPSTRRRARLNLARFYIARGMSAEALGVLDVALSDNKGPADVTGDVLKSIAEIMLGRPEGALNELAKPQIGNQLDARIWRAVAYARQGKWAEARQGSRIGQGDCRTSDRITAHGDDGGDAHRPVGARLRRSLAPR